MFETCPRRRTPWILVPCPCSFGSLQSFLCMPLHAERVDLPWCLEATSVATVKVSSRALLCFLLGASWRLTFSLASEFRVLRVHFHEFRLLFLLPLLCWLCNLGLRAVRGSMSQDLDCLLPSNEVLRYQVLKKPLKESLDDSRVLGRHQ